MTVIATGAILAGGLSSRFGSNKALAPWDGGRLIETAVERLLDVFPSVLVLAKKPESYSFLRRPRLDVLEDAVANVHPTAGLFTALTRATTEWVFVTACDMPFVSPALIRRLWDDTPGHDAVVPVWNGAAQPLCAFYSKRCAEALADGLPAWPSPRELLARVRTRRVSPRCVRDADPDGSSFFDIDTLTDHQEAMRRHADRRVRP